MFRNCFTGNNWLWLILIVILLVCLCDEPCGV